MNVIKILARFIGLIFLLVSMIACNKEQIKDRDSNEIVSVLINTAYDTYFKIRFRLLIHELPFFLVGCSLEGLYLYLDRCSWRTLKNPLFLSLKQVF